jgi:hypothetical protein
VLNQKYQMVKPPPQQLQANMPRKSTPTPPRTSHVLLPFFALPFFPFLDESEAVAGWLAAASSGTVLTAAHVGHLHFPPARVSATFKSVPHAEQLNAILMSEAQSRRAECWTERALSFSSRLFDATECFFSGGMRSLSRIVGDSATTRKSVRQ